jgi:prepilin-type N-terminal cleavage/methylation domain-containing protein
MRQRARGFTLIELMVVIGIILLLVAVIAVGLSGAFGKSDHARTKATLEVLKSNIQSFETRWGKPPPSTVQGLADLTRSLNLANANETNEGIEALVLALRSQREGGPYIAAELLADNERRANMDNDTFMEGAMDPSMLDIPGDTANDLFEIVDAWGNPFIYVNIGDLRAGLARDKITLASGETIELSMEELQQKLRHKVTGGYPPGFALWSVGENGVNEYGLGDDITSWPKYNEEE